jgi:predicted aspartyl protease
METQTMGEVVVEVTLTNLTEPTRTLTAPAVADTGATLSSIPASVAQELALPSRAGSLARFADGRTEPVLIAEGLRWEIGGRVTTDEALILGDQILIEQTVLKKTHWLVDCAGKRLVPDPAQPEYPIFRV